jgi:hypothetical protein
MDAALLEARIFHYRALQNTCEKSIEHAAHEIKELMP